MLPRALLKSIIQRTSALVYEARISGRAINPDEARRQAVAEVVHAEKVARGLVSNPAQTSWLAGKQTLERLSKEMEGQPIATPSPELEAEAAAGIAEFEAQPCSPGLKAFFGKIHRMALEHARRWREPRPAPRATTVDVPKPVAEKRPTPKSSSRRVRPAAPPADQGAGPLVIVRGGASSKKWIGGDVPDRSSYGA